MDTATTLSMNAANTLSGGFDDAVMDGQSVFRTLLDCMANPGTVRMLPVATRPPEPLGKAAAAVLLAMADQDTSLWFDKPLQDCASLKEWIAFHCGSPIEEEHFSADFAVICDVAKTPQLSMFKPGTQEYPDRSAMLILQCGRLADDAGNGMHDLVLEGPGIKEQAAISVEFLPPDFINQWTALKPKFPLGIDIILAGSDADGRPAIACMPRTARIVREGV